MAIDAGIVSEIGTASELTRAGQVWRERTVCAGPIGGDTQVITTAPGRR